MAYPHHCDGIRREFAAVPPAAFASERAAFLRLLLALPAIFKSAYYRKRFEAAARRNLQNELRRLDCQFGEIRACN